MGLILKSNTHLLHNKGYKGKEIKIAVWDWRGSDKVLNDLSLHPECVENIALQTGPEAETKIFIYSDIENDMRAMVDWGADICNISMSGIDIDLNKKFASLQEQKIYDEFFNNVYVVASAGNSGKEEYKYPSATEEYQDKCLAVGACEYDGRYGSEVRMANYSTTNDRIDIVNFTGIKLNKDIEYKGRVLKRGYKFNGTSCSAPYTSGQVACFMQMYKEVFGGKPTIKEITVYMLSNLQMVEENGYPVMHVIKGETMEVRLQIGSQFYMVDGERKRMTGEKIIDDKSILVDIKPVIIDGRTYVPARFIAEPFDLEVEWVPETKEIIIRNKELNTTSD